MKRRGFLQSLAGFVGLAVAPTLPAKQKPTIINPEPGIYVDGKKVTLGKFDHLTVDHFGAANTKSLARVPGPAFFTGMTWYPPSDYFPDVAEEGDAFYFTPKTYLGYPLDEKTKDRLECCYIFTTNGWRPILGISKTEN
jgi:hypothetical protein